MTFSPDKFKLSVLFVVVVVFLLPCVRLTLHVKQRGPFLLNGSGAIRTSTSVEISDQFFAKSPVTLIEEMSFSCFPKLERKPGNISMLLSSKIFVSIILRLTLVF